MIRVHRHCFNAKLVIDDVKRNEKKIKIISLFYLYAATTSKILLIILKRHWAFFFFFFYKLPVYIGNAIFQNRIFSSALLPEQYDLLYSTIFSNRITDTIPKYRLITLLFVPIVSLLLLGHIYIYIYKEGINVHRAIIEVDTSIYNCYRRYFIRYIGGYYTALFYFQISYVTIEKYIFIIQLCTTARTSIIIIIISLILLLFDKEKLHFI